MAARKLSLQPRPRTMCGRGRWKGSSFFLTSATAVCKLSKELDFFKPSVGPKSLLGESGKERAKGHLVFYQGSVEAWKGLLFQKYFGLGILQKGVLGGWQLGINPSWATRAHTLTLTHMHTQSS